MSQFRPFVAGFKAILPVVTGVIPFGAVMGTVSAEAGLSYFQTFGMNLLVYAGASQLAAVDLMSQNTTTLVVLVTALVINIRFVLYSAAMAMELHGYPTLTKMLAAYFLTDQNYAVMAANQHRLKTVQEMVRFYFGSCAAMMLSWHASVLLGFAFGNFAPTSWALDYAIPLSFVALLMPTLRNSQYWMVAGFSAVVAVLLASLPYKLGLIATATLSVALSAFLTRPRREVS